jgi:hypothetical protein
MCELCANPDEKTILLELRNIHIKPGAKFEAGIDALSKALGYDSERQQKEVSPFKAVRDLEELSKKTVEKGLLKLYNEMRKTWFSMEKAVNPKAAFVLNGRIFINPKSGKPLTNAEWKIIKSDVLKAFNYVYSNEEERIALHALSLGKVLKGLPLEKQINASYNSLKDQVNDAMSKLTGPEWQNTVIFAKQEAGNKIVELKQQQYNQIHDTLQNAIKNRYSSGQLSEELFDRFGSMNRDWRRIAETEIGNSQNNGQLITELERKGPEEEYIFMKGVSSSEACPWCRNEVDGVIVVLMDSPPSKGDTITINGETYPVIWPGKTNYGRKRSNWWIAAGTQHPHCRCTWVKYVPGYEKWDDMFHDAMEQALARGEAMNKKKAAKNLKAVFI